MIASLWKPTDLCSRVSISVNPTLPGSDWSRLSEIAVIERQQLAIGFLPFNGGYISESSCSS